MSEMTSQFYSLEVQFVILKRFSNVLPSAISFPNNNEDKNSTKIKKVNSLLEQNLGRFVCKNKRKTSSNDWKNQDDQKDDALETEQSRKHTS